MSTKLTSERLARYRMLNEDGLGLSSAGVSELLDHITVLEEELKAGKQLGGVQRIWVNDPKHGFLRRVSFTPEDGYVGYVPMDTLDAANSLAEAAMRRLVRVKEELKAAQDAIRRTLDENGHLADGENCTLIHLKRALRLESEVK